MEPNLNLSPQVTHQPSLLGGAENMKLLFDTVMALQLQSVADNQRDARRRADNAAAFDHLVSMTAAASGQVGDTSAQQTTSPIRTGIGDSMAATAYPANRAVDVAAAGQAVNADTINAAVTAGIANAITGSIPVLVSAIGDAVAAAVARALNPNASTTSGNPTPAAG